MIQNIFSEELIQAIGWTMIHSLWQGFIVAILMGIAMIGLQKKSAKVRYELAWFALFLVFVLSLSTFIYLYDATMSGEILGGTITVIAEGGFMVENAVTVQTFFQKTISYFNEHLHLIVTFWLVGMGFFLLRLLGGLAYIEKLKHQKQKALPQQWQVSFKKLISKFPIKKSVQVVESGLATVPMVIGYLKPIILIPIGAVNHLSQQEIEAVLAHELAHIYRNDYLLNIIQSFIETIFYYHPAVWWISANIRTERENCCDDIAVHLCGNSLNYVKALVSLEEMQPAPTLAMSFSSGRKNQLLNRVKRILNQPQNKFNIMEKFTATCFLLVALFFFSVSATQPNNPQNDMEQVIMETPISTSQVETVSEKYPLVVEESLEFISNDTIPTHLKGTGNFVYSTDDETVEVKYENDEITQMKINGEVIPEDEFEDYKEYVEELIHDIPTPPAPPSAPSFHFATPESPSFSYHYSGSNAPHDGKIIISKNEDGNTVIIKNTGDDDAAIFIGDGILRIGSKEINVGDAPIIMKHDSDDLFNFDGDLEIYSMDELKGMGGSIAVIPDMMIDLDLPISDLGIPEFPELPELPEMPEINFDALDNFEFKGNFNFDTIPMNNIWIDGNRVDWDELSEEEKEEYRQQLEEAKASLREAQTQLKQEMRQNMEEARERMKEAKEQMREAQQLQQEQIKEMQESVRVQQREQMKEAREQMREAQALQQEQMKEMRETIRVQQRERMEEARERSREIREEARQVGQRGRGQWTYSFENQLQNDGHIKSDGSYKFSMDDKKLKINGKKQSKADLKKYIELYEKSTGQSLGRGFQVGLSYDGKKNRSTSVSISDEAN